MSTIVDLTVVTFEGGVPIDGVRMKYLRSHRSRLDRFYLTPLLLRKDVKRIPADIVHAFGDDWALTRATPIVRTFLGSSRGEARASTGLRKVNHYVLAITEARSRRRASYAIAIGPDSMSEFDCDTVMPPVVEVHRPADAAKTTDPSVVFIGSFGGRKRGELVERSVAQASVELGREVTLSVIGPSADAHNWAPETEHVSGADDTAVATLVASSWVLMAPSLYEGFGIPAFEALSLGTAVIASRNPGSEYIKSFGMQSSLELADDALLAARLTTRLRLGPDLSPAELAETRTGVRSLLDASDPGRLLREVYGPLAERE